VLLLDEPLSALDAKVRSQLREHIRTLQLKLGITTLFVTHDQEEALSISDRVGVMSNGRLQQVGVPAEVYENPVNSFVAEFVGIASRLPGTVRHDGAVETIGVVLPIPARCTGYSAGDEVDVLLRPEAVRVRRDGAGHGVVTQRSFLGSMMRVVVALAGGFEVVASVPATAASEVTIGTVVAVEPVSVLYIAPRRAAGAEGAGAEAGVVTAGAPTSSAAGRDVAAAE
jgi:putative spermidine/putrescine transport system ATP-binding protein